MGKRKISAGPAGKWVLGILAALVLAVGVGGYALWQGLSLSVELAGEGSLLQEYGQTYRDPGARAVLRSALLPEEKLILERTPVEITGAPDGQKLGKYTLHYQASFLGLHGEQERRVTVIDSVCPVITLESREGNQPVARAVDNLDGDLTDRVKCVEKDGVLYYSVADRSGNPASAQWKIPAGRSEPPVIRLEGGEELSIPVGTFFSEPGYTAADTWDIDLTDKVQVEGEVIWWEAGIYPLTYTVTDGMGRSTMELRTVQVVAQDWPETVYPEGKTVYLTFDDGPGPYTEKLLDVLDRYGVKATFFVTDSGYDAVLADIAARGHSIGIHTVSHRYEQIYASPESYFQDLSRMQQIIRENTGIETTLLRFPGGSSNEVSRQWCPGIMTTLSQSVRDAGYQYFDWNVDSDDAGGAQTAQKVFENVTEGIQNNRISIVLQHDTHRFSVEAVEKILRWGRENGYRFLPLKPESPGFHHNVRN